MKEKNRFDLEQEILGCWNVTGDIGVVLDMMDNDASQDDIMNALIGIKTLYNQKFQTTFDTFEACLSRREFKEKASMV